MIDMRLLCYLLGFSVAIAINASAQSFSGSSGITASNPQSAAKTAEERVLKSAPKPQEQFDDQMQNSVVNINADKAPKEPVYDNSSGKVVSFKIVKGKVIFDDDRDRKILVSTSNFEVNKGMDGIVRCKMRVYVLNDLTERINNFGFKLIWPEISTSIDMTKVNPGVRTYRDIMLLGDGCFSMDKNPTIEVNRCRVKGRSEEACANAVKWFKNLVK